MDKKIAIIAGGGPAGLTAAYELLMRSDIHPIVLEREEDIGGLAKTIDYKGNKLDIGGHRFFSKSKRVLDWWKNIMVMQTLHRKSRIYFNQQFFDYPISLHLKTVQQLGFKKSIRIFLSYLHACLFPRKPEKNLRDFLINRFGTELYLMFFRSYTKKVWGIPCRSIGAEWGSQRIKGLSLSKAVISALKKMFKSKSTGLETNVETSLIERFLYPKYGPGQMWSEVSKQILKKGGEIKTLCSVERIQQENGKIKQVSYRDQKTKELHTLDADYFFSSMPVNHFINSLNPEAPAEIKSISDNLVFRDFMIVGLLLSQMKVKLDDNWIYIQDGKFKVGRIQIFNNWGSGLVADRRTTWIGMEYFSSKGEALWNLPDEEMIALAKDELVRMKFADSKDIVDAMIYRAEKAYPAYFGGYEKMHLIREYTDGLENCFLIGRNGMHRYNNQDHSMLSAMTAVDNILSGRTDKSNIWQVNADSEYHEAKD